MADFMETEDKRSVIKEKLRQQFDGKIVRKDLTKKIKEGANVPVYVLEFLLGQYCSSDDPEVVEDGVNNVKRILADNFVRPDEAQKILSILRQRGSYTVIDKITVNLNIKRDYYEAEFSNLGLKDIPIDEEYPAKFDRLLCGGIWCIVQLDYEFMEEDRNGTPIRIRKLTPIQMPHVDIAELKQGRRAFAKDVLNEFKENTNSVLLGTGAYWEGISIEGKSLSNVVIFRLPFPVPDPIIEYKASIAKDPLMDVRVPEMVIKLKQGIGRLIRNFTDTGIVCIIDRRLRDEPPERYHDVTWASLPIKNKTRSLDELRNFYESLPSRHDDVER